MIAFVIVISCLSLAFAVYLARQVLSKDTGTQKMQDISNAIKEGAEAFMSRQNRTIISLSAVLAALIFVLYAFVRTPIHDATPNNASASTAARRRSAGWPASNNAVTQGTNGSE